MLEQLNKNKKITIIPGEGAAAEAIYWSTFVLDHLQIDAHFHWVKDPPKDPLERCSWLNDTKQLIDESDATLFGACAEHFIDILVYLRWGKNTFANLRPIKWMAGYASPLKNPEGIDFIIVRENTEDLYVGLEGSLSDLPFSNPMSSIALSPIPLAGEGRFSVKINTFKAIERITQRACEIACKRKAKGYRGKLTVSGKTNVLASDRFFCEIARKICEREYPELIFEEFIIDDFARRLIASPQSFDVILLPNLYGDILSDEAAATIGGLGLCGSGCYGESFAYFEPVHGAALDLLGKHAINPTATLFSCCLLLEYIGFEDKARQLAELLQKAYAQGKYLTPDQGGKATTEEFCHYLLEIK